MIDNPFVEALVTLAEKCEKCRRELPPEVLLALMQVEQIAYGTELPLDRTPGACDHFAT